MNTPARRLFAVATCLVLVLNGTAASEDDLRAGRNFIDTQVYTEADDRKILDAFEGDMIDVEALYTSRLNWSGY